ncbi:hypothetical protein KEJ21_07460 [Candidatus Bathyarchaeota archaeon]|nr:hypothetical protein [Candidatus Bathyarchaeota archaeon]MBS7631658.1 hypothetical protein [Candidatus Bathyarchaeota archaeon]
MLGEELQKNLVETIELIIPNTVALLLMPHYYSVDNHLILIGVATGLSGGIERLQVKCEEIETEVTIIDNKLFEEDVESSTLLEIAASRLLLSYQPIKGKDYFKELETRYKMRKIKESLSNLIMDHASIAHELLIDPRYFVNDILTRLSHLLPGILEHIQNMDDHPNTLLLDYLGALNALKREGILHSKDDYFIIDKRFIEKTLGKSPLRTFMIGRAQKMLDNLLRMNLSGAFDLLHLIHPRSSIEGLLIQRTFKSAELPRREEFLYYPTATRIASLKESSSLDEMLARIESSRVKNIRIQRFGEVLNEVYLIIYEVNETSKNAILKRYPSWISLKWGPLALWTLGTQNFSILGKTRMERECAAISYLSKKGIQVPRILEASFENKMIIREYIEGESLATILRKVIKNKGPSKDEVVIEKVGETVAKIHDAGATLGDCKPENFIVQPSSDLMAVDFEQSGLGGNEAWDLAEFLYFMGHYADPLDPLDRVVEITSAFIKGYVEHGGDSKNFLDAAKIKYAKTFTPITLPNVIYAISKTCKKESKLYSKA